MTNRLILLLLLLPATLLVAFDPPSVFPVSTRQALVEKSKQVNPPSSQAQYTTSGWSNRAATVLTPVCVEPYGVYTVDRPFYWNNIDVGCRCTVVDGLNGNGDDNNLFVHSPVGLDGPLQQALSKLGRVKYIVSPNYEHVKFAAQWNQAYPDAEMWACPGLSERLPEIKWEAEIPDGYRPPGWKGGDGTYLYGESGTKLLDTTNQIQAMHIDVEVNPFTGKPFFNEVIFFHVPTKTLITTDLFWNYPTPIPNKEFGHDDSWELAPAVDSIPLGSRLWKFGMDKIFLPFYSQLMVQDKTEYHEIANHIINVWQPETVIPAHGDILRGKDFIRNVLSKHFQLE